MDAPADPDFRHDVPSELQAMLDDDPALAEKWGALTELGRNEWICWIEDAKRETTRHGRITRARENLTAGKRRPCCWPGCPHRERTGKA